MERQSVKNYRGRKGNFLRVIRLLIDGKDARKHVAAMFKVSDEIIDSWVKDVRKELSEAQYDYDELVGFAGTMLQLDFFGTMRSHRYNAKSAHVLADVAEGTMK